VRRALHALADDDDRAHDGGANDGRRHADEGGIDPDRDQDRLEGALLRKLQPFGEAVERGGDDRDIPTAN
jgi:hypothetical protein